MTRRLTDKLQISGYRLLVQRIEQGLISRDVRGFASPFSKQGQAFAIGLGLGGLILVAALLMSVLRPAALSGDAKILGTSSGSRYVVSDGVVHPVTNLASARLIAGTPADTKIVKDSEIDKFPRGMLMGIPSAPDAMIARGDDVSRWAVCSQYDAQSELSLTSSTQARTIVITGDDTITPSTRIGDGTALLVSAVRPVDGGAASTASPSIWLLYKGKRLAVDTSAYSLKTTLRINDEQIDKAVPVTEDFINSIPERTPFTRPSIANDGAVSTALNRQRVGSVATTDGPDGTDHWLILDNGVEKIGPFVANLMTNSGAPTTNNATATEMASVPQRSDFDFSEFPWDTPTIDNASSTVCYDWSRRGDADADGQFHAGPSVPLTADQRAAATAFLPARNSTPQADYFYTTPGKGWLVSATGQPESSRTEGQLWWVADNGIRYAIGATDDAPINRVLETLGLNPTHAPNRVPWSVLQLLPQGNTLSPDAARVVHANIPPEMAQAPAPPAPEIN